MRQTSTQKYWACYETTNYFSCDSVKSCIIIGATYKKDKMVVRRDKCTSKFVLYVHVYRHIKDIYNLRFGKKGTIRQSNCMMLCWVCTVLIMRHWHMCWLSIVTLLWGIIKITSTPNNLLKITLSTCLIMHTCWLNILILCSISKIMRVSMTNLWSFSPKPSKRLKRHSLLHNSTKQSKWSNIS